jgi:hypothetical protein
MKDSGIVLRILWLEKNYYNGKSQEQNVVGERAKEMSSS